MKHLPHKNRFAASSSSFNVAIEQQNYIHVQISENKMFYKKPTTSVPFILKCACTDSTDVSKHDRQWASTHYIVYKSKWKMIIRWKLCMFVFIYWKDDLIWRGSYMHTHCNQIIAIGILICFNADIEPVFHYSFFVPFPIEISLGRNWSEISPMKMIVVNSQKSMFYRKIRFIFILRFTWAELFISQ